MLNARLLNIYVVALYALAQLSDSSGRHRHFLVLGEAERNSTFDPATQKAPRKGVKTMIPMRAFYVFLAVAGFLIAMFTYAAWSTRRPRDTDTHSAYALRKKLLLIVVAVLVIGLALTLAKTPYPRETDIPAQVVFVAGKQFSFGISASPITNDDEYLAATYSTPVEIAAGSLVEFRVTSFDVNHSIGVYSPDNQLIAQTQAMPGYVNRLRVRFTQPGRYRVLCLELCGSGHHRMRGVFDVK